MRPFALLLAASTFLAIPTFARAKVQITQLRADLEMKDFHDHATLSGPLKVGVPVTLAFKDEATVRIVPLSINDDTIKLTAELVRDGGQVLYDSSFFTHYNVDADLSEKTPGGDLVYRLKINPEIAPR